MKMESKIDNFETTSIPRAVLSNAIPAIVSMMVVLIYNVADTFFIGQTGDAMQVAAVSLATPVFLLFMSVGTLYGIGGTSVISRSLGRSDGQHAKEVSSFCFWMSLFSGLAFIVIFLVCMDSILTIIGTSNDTRELTRSYLTIVAWGAPFVLISTAFSNIVRAEGRSTEAMTGTLIGTVLNIVLDPVFILVLDMGISGAAWATVIGNVVATAYYIRLLIGSSSLLSISPRLLRFCRVIFREVFSIGTPACLQSVMMSVSSILLNMLLAVYGDLSLAAYGIAVKVLMVVTLLQMGLGQGIQPLLGYHFGGGRRQVFLSVMRFSNIVAVGMGVVLTLLCWWGSDALVCQFIDSKKVQTMGVAYLKILLLSGPILGLMFNYINALQAMGAARYSFILSISRQGIIFIPCMLLFNVMLGQIGLVWAQPIADVLSLFMSFWLFKRK